jgi:hypothetical protein
MALNPVDETHAFQIEAGTVGRKKGHAFERQLAEAINNFDLTNIPCHTLSHVEIGNPAVLLIGYIVQRMHLHILRVKAGWLGGLATAQDGDVAKDDEGNIITKCKSDVLIDIDTLSGIERIGISVKTCNNKIPANDQMYFTTAKAFCRLLKDNGISCSGAAIAALSMFCGDFAYRPVDLMSEDELKIRLSDPERYHWEELPSHARNEWEYIFKKYQSKITMLLFQKAYKNDPYPPCILLHQTVRYESFDNCQIALFTMDEIVSLSCRYAGFHLHSQRVIKGRYKSDPAKHDYPRFGFIQFQRGGQKQHPTQLQFNLKAGYFNHLPFE